MDDAVKWVLKREKILKSYDKKDETYVCSIVEEKYRGKFRDVDIKIEGNNDLCDSIADYIASKGG